MRPTARAGLLGLVAGCVLAGMPAAAEPGPAAGPTTLSVGLVADVQYCDCDPKRTRYYRDSLEKLAAAANVLNQRDVDLTIQLGDVIDRYSESFDAILPVYAQVDGRRHHVLGNHDFPLPSPAVVRRLGMPNEYYDISLPGWRFVVLDTNDISLYANEPGSQHYQRAQQMLADLEDAGAPNAHGFNGAAGKRQLRWLRGVLADANANGQRVIAFGHMPIHGSSTHNAWDDTAIRQALEQAGNVAAYIHGHDHAGGYAIENGIHHLGLQGMVEQPAPSSAYAVMQVTTDVLVIDGYDREPDRVLPLS